MNDELVFRQFEEIEQKVERLIEICKAHEAANLELKLKIKSLEEEIQGKVEAERSYAEEKALIRSKIDGLLARIDVVTRHAESRAPLGQAAGRELWRRVRARGRVWRCPRWDVMGKFRQKLSFWKSILEVSKVPKEDNRGSFI